MRDIKMDLYDAFLADEFISQHVTNGNIKFYEYPNAQAITGTVIVIDEIISPEIKDFADNNPMTLEYIFQIDVFVKQTNNNVNASVNSSELILRIQKLMWEVFGFGVFNSFAPEYNSDHKLARQSKQFRGRKYISN